MTAISILSDQVYTAPLVFTNGVPATTTAPLGDTFTVKCNSNSLGAAVIGVGSASGPSLQLTPKVLAGSGYVVTVTDGTGLSTLTLNVTITQDPAEAATWSINTSAATTVAQAPPNVAGP